MLLSLRAFILTGLLLGVFATSTRGEIKYKAALLHPSAGYFASLSYDATTGRQVGYAQGEASSFRVHAIMWNGAADDFVDLHPANHSESVAYNISESGQVGFVEPSYASRAHAAVWHGTPESWIDLHPPGFDESFAEAVSGDYQVGTAYNDGPGINANAFLWKGTAESAINLNPPGYYFSLAFDIAGEYQGGYGSAAPNAPWHALLWNGSAESYVDLHPDGFGSDYSFIEAMSGDVQVGAVGFQAALWRGTAASAVNLNPIGAVESHAYDVEGNWQVGYTRKEATHNDHRAAVWRGTAQSVVDLHDSLANLPLTIDFSMATGVGIDGTVSGTGYDDEDNHYALIWTPYLVGDYNGNRVVDVADYVVWRDSLDQAGDNLPADGNGDGEITTEDYSIWKQHFGDTFESSFGAASRDEFGFSQRVPEPAAPVLLLIALAAYLVGPGLRR